MVLQIHFDQREQHPLGSATTSMEISEQGRQKYVRAFYCWGGMI
jgi:hypothetical protein